MEAGSISTLLNWMAGIVAAVLVGKLLLVLTRSTRYAKMIDALPGPYALPILGNVLDFWVPPEDAFATLINFENKFAHETVTRYWLGPFKTMIMVHTAKGAEIILNNTRHITKADEYSYLHSWLGLGLLTRKLLTPSFHFQILDDFVTVFNEQSQILVGLLKKKAGKGPFNIYPYITHCALDIICESAMGTQHNAQNDNDSEYAKAVYGMGSIFLMRVMRPWMGNGFLFNFFPQKRQETHYLDVLHSHTRKVIEDRKDLRQNKNNVKTDKEEICGQKRRLAFLDALLDAQMDGKAISDEEIREQVDTFMFEGHDTVSAALVWSLFQLGHHPEIQTKLQDELDNILGDSNRPIGAADISQMKYLNAVIKEALRLYPSAPLFGRKLKEDVNVDGHIIPAETNVYVGAYFIHRNPDVFPEPEKFKPERFLQQDITKRNPFSYIPFSAGPRNCIGQKFAQMEEKVVLANIVRNFRVFSHDKREGLKTITQPVLRPAFGLNMSVEMRTKIIS